METKEDAKFFVFYGTSHKQMDITFDVLLKCCKGKTIHIPGTNQKQDELFSDPYPNVIKTISIQGNENITQFPLSVEKDVVYDCELNGDFLRFANLLRKENMDPFEFALQIIINCYCQPGCDVLKIGMKYNIPILNHFKLFQIEANQSQCKTSHTSNTFGALAYHPVVILNGKVQDYVPSKLNSSCFTLDQLQEKSASAYHTIVFESQHAFCKMMHHKERGNMLENLTCLIVQWKGNILDYTTEINQIKIEYGFVMDAVGVSKDGCFRIFKRQTSQKNVSNQTMQKIEDAIERYCKPFTHVLLVGAHRIVLPVSIAHNHIRFTIIEQNEERLSNFVFQHVAQPHDLFGPVIHTAICGTFCGQEDTKECTLPRFTIQSLQILHRVSFFHTLVFESINALDMALRDAAPFVLQDTQQLIVKCAKNDPRLHYSAKQLTNFTFYLFRSFAYRDTAEIHIWRHIVNLV